MTLTMLLTGIYLVCFQFCAIPAILKIRRRGSSADLSCWREVMLLVGVSVQFAVMLRTGAKLEVFISPICSGVNVAVLLGHVLYYRQGRVV